MASNYHFKNGAARRWSRGSMKFGQSWDAEAQARHNSKRGKKWHKKYILSEQQELAETVKRQMED